MFFLSQFNRLLSEEVSEPQRIIFSKDYKTTEQQWGKNHRKSVKRKINKLIKEGELKLFVSNDSEEIKLRLPILFEQHCNKWKKAGKPSFFENQPYRDFYYNILNIIPEKYIQYSEVRLNEKVISSHFGFINNNWIYWYKPAYDIKMERFSPGLVHIALLVKYGINSGLVGIDFLQGDERYKYSWSNDNTLTVNWVLASNFNLLWWYWEVKYRNKMKYIYNNVISKLRKITSEKF